MSKLSSIFQGWKSYFKGEVQEFMIDRAKICLGKNMDGGKDKCTHAKEGTFEIILTEKEGSELKEVEGLKCSLCNCPLATKLRSEIERCPVDKW